MISMIQKVLPFELKYRFGKPIAYLMLLMLAFQGLWFSLGIHDWYANQSTLINAAGIAYLALSAGGMLLIIIVALITASTLYRDIEQRSASFIYAYPIEEKPFFVAHFLSAWLINIIMILGYVVGLVVLKYLGLVSEEYIGPVAWGAIAHAVLFFAIPNMLTYTALAFFALVMTKRIIAVYATIITVVMIFVVGQTISEESPRIELLSIIDPFGYIYARNELDLMSVAEKNSALMPLNWVYWVNRTLWISISVVLASFAYSRFRFKDFIKPPGINNKVQNIKHELSIVSLENPVNIPKISFSYGIWESLIKGFRLAWIEFKNITRPASFKLILGIIVVLILAQNLVWNSTYYLGYQYPITSGMTSARLINGFLLIIILMILAGESFFKDRVANLWQISGATPSTVWELQLPKLFAMFSVAFLFASTIFVGGLFSQLIQGFTDIDWSLYIEHTFGYMWGWLNYVFYICFVFVVASLTGQRFLTHCLTIGYYFFIIISYDLGLVENIQFIYSGVPGYDEYSEINGYGVFALSGFWFFLLWSSLAVFFVFLGLHFWRRGVAQSFIGRLLGRGGEISLWAKLAALIPLACFIGVQGVISREVYDKRNHIPVAQRDAEAAAYEKTYSNLLSRYDVRTGISALKVDLFPSERKAVTTASLELKNSGEKPVKKLYFNLDNFSEIISLTLANRSVKIAERDPILGMTAYTVEPAIQPGMKAKTEMLIQRQYTGFSQSGDVPQGDLAYNGAMYDEIIPVIGYDDEKALDGERIRQAHNLPAITTEAHDLLTNHATRDYLTDFTLVGDKLDLIVTTESDQTPIGSGELIEYSSQESRSKGVFRLTDEGSLQLFVGSGRYAERKVEIEGVSVTYQYHPSHAYNLEAFDTCLSRTFQFIRQHLGEYPYETLRIVEIPFYQEPSYTSAHVIALSEKEGWYADYNVGEARSFVQFTLARELIRQWIDQQGTIKDQKGAGMLWRALPSALAMQIVKETSDQDSLESLIEKIRTKYNKERYNDEKTEVSLLQTNDIAYLEETKGTLALYRLSQSIGFQAMNQSLREWFENLQGRPLVFAELYADLKTKNRLKKPVQRLFEAVDPSPEL